MKHHRLATAELPAGARPTHAIRPEVPDHVPPEHAPVGSVNLQIRTLTWERDEARRERDEALRELEMIRRGVEMP